MSRTPSICIVSPNYISSTPRVVKEADALHQAGFSVRVVFSQGNLEKIRVFDEELLVEKLWSYTTFGWSSERSNERNLYHFSRIRCALARKLPIALYQYANLAEIAQGRVYPELARVAAFKRADLYIGHYPDGLAAAAYAAKYHRALLGYDFEDFHIGEGSDLKNRYRTELIEQRNLPQCSYITAVSPLIADEIEKRYRVKRPTVIHNVFPWSDRSSLDGQIKDRRGEALSIYWYSQTIGLDRGIQDAIRAVGLIDAPIQIHLRGALSDNVRQTLITLATQNGIADRLYFHERVSPNELLSRAVEHDIGLALEPFKDANNGITSSNKLFLYLLAGLCIAATDVPGQLHVMKSIPDAGYLYPVGDYAALANILKNLIEHPALLKHHKEAALAAARDKWNWEIESQKLVEAVNSVFGQHLPPRKTL